MAVMDTHPPCRCEVVICLGKNKEGKEVWQCKECERKGFLEDFMDTPESVEEEQVTEEIPESNTNSGFLNKIIEIFNFRRDNDNQES